MPPGGKPEQHAVSSRSSSRPEKFNNKSHKTKILRRHAAAAAATGQQLLSCNDRIIEGDTAGDGELAFDPRKTIRLSRPRFLPQGGEERVGRGVDVADAGDSESYERVEAETVHVAVSEELYVKDSTKYEDQTYISNNTVESLVEHETVTDTQMFYHHDGGGEHGELVSLPADYELVETTRIYNEEIITTEETTFTTTTTTTDCDGLNNRDQTTIVTSSSTSSEVVEEFVELHEETCENTRELDQTPSAAGVNIRVARSAHKPAIHRQTTAAAHHPSPTATDADGFPVTPLRRMTFLKDDPALVTVTTPSRRETFDLREAQTINTPVIQSPPQSRQQQPQHSQRWRQHRSSSSSNSSRRSLGRARSVSPDRTHTPLQQLHPVTFHDDTHAHRSATAQQAEVATEALSPQKRVGTYTKLDSSLSPALPTPASSLHRDATFSGESSLGDLDLPYCSSTNQRAAAGAEATPTNRLKLSIISERSTMSRDSLDVSDCQLLYSSQESAVMSSSSVVTRPAWLSQCLPVPEAPTADDDGSGEGAAGNSSAVDRNVGEIETRFTTNERLDTLETISVTSTDYVSVYMTARTSPCRLDDMSDCADNDLGESDCDDVSDASGDVFEDSLARFDGSDDTVSSNATVLENSALMTSLLQQKLQKVAANSFLEAPSLAGGGGSCSEGDAMEDDEDDGAGNENTEQDKSNQPEVTESSLAAEQEELNTDKSPQQQIVSDDTQSMDDSYVSAMNYVSASNSERADEEEESVRENNEREGHCQDRDSLDAILSACTPPRQCYNNLALGGVCGSSITKTLKAKRLDELAQQASAFDDSLGSLIASPPPLPPVPDFEASIRPPTAANVLSSMLCRESVGAYSSGDMSEVVAPQNRSGAGDTSLSFLGSPMPLPPVPIFSSSKRLTSDSGAAKATNGASTTGTVNDTAAAKETAEKQQEAQRANDSKCQAAMTKQSLPVTESSVNPAANTENALRPPPHRKSKFSLAAAKLGADKSLASTTFSFRVPSASLDSFRYRPSDIHAHAPQNPFDMTRSSNIGIHNPGMEDSIFAEPGDDWPPAKDAHGQRTVAAAMMTSAAAPEVSRVSLSSTAAAVAAAEQRQSPFDETASSCIASVYPGMEDSIFCERAPSTSFCRAMPPPSSQPSAQVPKSRLFDDRRQQPQQQHDEQTRPVDEPPMPGGNQLSSAAVTSSVRESTGKKSQTDEERGSGDTSERMTAQPDVVSSSSPGVSPVKRTAATTANTGDSSFDDAHLDVPLSLDDLEPSNTPMSPEGVGSEQQQHHQQRLSSTPASAVSASCGGGGDVTGSSSGRVSHFTPSPISGYTSAFVTSERKVTTKQVARSGSCSQWSDASAGTGMSDDVFRVPASVESASSVNPAAARSRRQNETFEIAAGATPPPPLQIDNLTVVKQRPLMSETQLPTIGTAPAPKRALFHAADDSSLISKPVSLTISPPTATIKPSADRLAQSHPLPAARRSAVAAIATAAVTTPQKRDQSREPAGASVRKRFRSEQQGGARRPPPEAVAVDRLAVSQGPYPSSRRQSGQHVTSGPALRLSRTTLLRKQGESGSFVFLLFTEEEEREHYTIQYYTVHTTENIHTHVYSIYIFRNYSCPAGSSRCSRVGSSRRWTSTTRQARIDRRP